MGHTFDTQNIEIWVEAFYMLNITHVNDVRSSPNLAIMQECSGSNVEDILIRNVVVLLLKIS